MLQTEHPHRVTAQVKAWDLPTRLFKWGLVAAIVSSWASHEWGDFELKWHRYTGYAVLVLLVFRLLWGVVGSSTAKFSAWVSWPWEAVRYGLDITRGRRRPYLSHNPLGAWMILMLLAIVSVQAVTGLFSVDSNGIFGGPFANTDPLADPTYWQKTLSRLHHQLFNILLGLVVVHVATNLFYQFVKKDPIVKAMVTGRKPVEPFEDQAEMRPAPAQYARALACLAAAAAIVLGGIKLFGGNLA
ncbi:MAG TPA: cytochrome b/b6 domain-containing protein [Beijerinckiaceae bacterium]|jgi:cytochrome b